ncbi:MAG: hypothetical protein E4H44_02360 [Candidatus Aminicenantes bacterium]|nr:MAG: hypothetical protein E4H44_02360 [Candidatus Aminicenantes bacterium]
MNSTRHYFITFLLVCLLLSACGASTTGPRTWIDIPKNNITVPLAPIPIMAHASDNGGVERFEFYVNGEFQSSIDPRFDDNTRLGWAEWEFTPAWPGVYRIEVSAVDTSGSSGSPATSIVTVSSEQAAPPPAQAAEPPAAEIPPSELPEAAEQEPVLDPVVEALKNANCREGPGTEYGIYASLLLGEQADIKGSLANNSWFLVALAGRSSNCWISASVVDTLGSLDEIGIAAAPPPPADVAEPLPEPAVPAPAADTTPPGIFGAATNKQIMCASDKVTSNVVAFDEGGINKVYANWNIINSNGDVAESGNVNYTPIPSIENAYTGVFGTFTYTGTLSINGTILDNAGNSASFSHTVTIDCS